MSACLGVWIVCVDFVAEYRRESAVAHSSGRSRLSLLLQSPSAKFLCSPDFFTVLHSNPVSPTCFTSSVTFDPVLLLHTSVYIQADIQYHCTQTYHFDWFSTRHSHGTQIQLMLPEWVIVSVCRPQCYVSVHYCNVAMLSVWPIVVV